MIEFSTMLELEDKFHLVDGLDIVLKIRGDAFLAERTGDSLANLIQWLLLIESMRRAKGVLFILSGPNAGELERYRLGEAVSAIVDPRAQIFGVVTHGVTWKVIMGLVEPRLPATPKP